MMAAILKGKQLPIVIIWIAVLIIFCNYFFGGSALGSAFRTLTVDWAVLIVNMALILGSVTLLQRSITLARSKNSTKVDRFMRAWTAFLVIFVLILGVTLGIQSGPYSWMYNNILLPSWQTVYSIIIFFMATAAYRAYKANNRYAAVLLAGGLLVLLRNAPVTAVVWGGFQTIGSWVLDVVNMSGTRAIMIGATIGAISLLVKILLGRERILGE